MRAAALLLALFLALPGPAAAAAPTADAPPLAVPGLLEEHLGPDFWISKLADPDRVILTPAQIASQNARMVAEDQSIFDLAALPSRLDAARVRGWIEGLATMPTRELFDEQGQPVAGSVLAGIQDNVAIGAVPASQDTRFGMVVRRADLRAFPTALRVFHSPDNSDIDRFQESTLFPGDPVVIAHESADGQWYFVVSDRYAAWIEKQYVAEGERERILARASAEPFLVVTGATASTVYTPENPRVSSVQLEMGVRVPVLADWPATRAINGQIPAAHWVIELPVRGDDGALSFEPALLPRSADVADDYLPLTEANIIRQAFKFLGERYGWGHSYNARDCSGFLSEIFRSFNVLIPRNTSRQSISPALDRLGFDENDSWDDRVAALAEARTGDMIYFPGHVMMMLGHVNGEPFVIHDTSGMSWLPDPEGELVRLQLNGVVVTPVLPMMSNRTTPTVNRITSIQRLRP
ncbi:MAG: NlpC-P60 family protein [Gammaproteobacteria bacterium]|nr:NlpC-P60 family protein [Gammaproteobacteria bacterium]